MPPTVYGRKLAGIAKTEFDTFHLQREHEPALARQIQKYWTALGLQFPGVDTAWSAVFVSWCVLTAGATREEFAFSPQHSFFVNRAIRNAENNSGFFRGFDIRQYAPTVGDILQNNRNGNAFDFQFARTHADYVSHSAIVIETGVDATGRYLLTVGGNESDSVGKKRVPLTRDGFVKQRTAGSFISVIQTLK